jgi:tetratricopeptide (TPR) repeat protein
MRRLRISALLGLLAWAALSRSAEQSFGDRIEMLDWSDPARAVKMVDAPALGKGRDSDVQFLEVQGMVFADVRRDSDVNATIGRLQAMADAGDQAAVVAVHYVKAYDLFQREQYSAASEELNHIDMKSIAADAEAYRVSILRGNTLRTLGQAEAALPFLEEGLDLARSMHDDQRTLHALLWLSRIYTTTGNYDRASEEVDNARTLATTLGDEAALTEVEIRASDVADRRGDHAAERRASLAALDHAKLSGSDKWLARASVNLSDSYLKTRDFNESLKYSKQALPLAAEVLGQGENTIAEFNEGLAYIGLGNF